MSTGQVATALELAALGVPVFPLRGKRPLSLCPACEGNRCGGRPHMRSQGWCECPRPCHGWAAATTDQGVITSPAWRRAWLQADGVGWHPGGAFTDGVTVVDLDDAAAVEWARATLPATRTVPTTRGEHWLYLGGMASSNAVRPGVDLKSRMAYAVWRGRGSGGMVRLPEAVLSLANREEATSRSSSIRVVLSSGAARVASSPGTVWERQVGNGCRHTGPFLSRGLQMAQEHITAHRTNGAGTAAYARARAIARAHRDCPGPCGLATVWQALKDAAVSVGVPEDYAARQVRQGIAAA
ncbi:bifunctional DNA primase/polymerase [Streptomyces sp. NPDC126933]|uniref:bifunctional DNA primase/polymerase n=1 Tax=unclassified Streptomyces TaxID=2593676 RepID=UPI00364C55BB